MKSLERFDSDRLQFRGFEADDFDDLFQILGDEEVCKYLPVEVYNKEQVKRILKHFIDTFVIEKKDLHYIVISKDTLEVVGYCGCSYIKEYDSNEIEYFLKKKYFGLGYATEMAFMMKEVAVELRLKSVVGLADINNVPSQVILKKLGYVYSKEVDHWGLKLKLYNLNLESVKD